MSGPLLSLRAVDAYYGAAHILRALSLDIAAGEAAALTGRNGAGKSTVLKTVIGLVRPARGQVRFAGADIAGLAPYRIARLGLGYVPQERRIFTDLTVAENLAVARRPPRPGLAPWTVQRLFALFPNLAGMAGRRASRMSGGEQQMLAVARTLMGNPRMILLDEPSEGLAPVIVEEMAGALRALRKEGVTVLLAEQNLRFAADVCDRAHVLAAGTVAFSGAMDVLMADTALRRAHLGI